MILSTKEIEKQATIVEEVNAAREKTPKESGKNQISTQRSITQPPNQQTCFRCGGNFPHSNPCPALRKNCNSCGKQGHFSRVCRSKGQQIHDRRGQWEWSGRNLREQGAYSKPVNTVDYENESRHQGELFSIFEYFERNELNAVYKKEAQESSINFETTVYIEKKVS